MNTQRFVLKAPFTPSGDQHNAVKQLISGLRSGAKHQTLLGVTGSGKTFTIANVIQAVQRPTLVIAPNKTLAAQLVAEFRSFFPKNAVEYFVSYYDYYQPEAYLPGTDTYIEKETDINDEIDRLRHAATAALLTRRDTIVVASVSCIYGLGSPAEYARQNLILTRGQTLRRETLIGQLVSMFYIRTEILKRGAFRAHGGTIEIIPPDREVIIRIELEGETIAQITEFDALTLTPRSKHLVGVNNEVSREITIFPAKHFVVAEERMGQALRAIEVELEERLSTYEKSGKLLEAERLERRTRHDLELLHEIGTCPGIENYSRYLTGRSPGQAPDTLLDFFPASPAGGPKDFLLVIDESHVTVPQIAGMYTGDRSRKQTLVEYGFRLPSALDNRPLAFTEFETRMPQTVYVSATPGKYELRKSRQAILTANNKQRTANRSKINRSPYRSDGIIQQIVRPTGLVDPEIIVRPATNQVADLLKEIGRVVGGNERVLVTTLTKKQAEQLTDYLKERDIKAGYLHSEVNTLDRIRVLNQLRAGEIDVLVGVNLLREGLDLPEVALVAILDADKEGFLRSETSLIQTMGRAARNVRGRVILYADHPTGSITRAIAEANRRRKIQAAYNRKHGITPRSIQKAIQTIIDHEIKPLKPAKEFKELVDVAELPKMIRERELEMKELAAALKFEEAALVRDEITELKRLIH